MTNIIFASGFIFLLSVLQFASSEDCIASACAKDTLQAEYGEIIYAGLIFRHGNRVPEKIYPLDPHVNYTWPFELGQLVNEGKQRAYHLGKFFRPRYIHLTGNKYTPSKVITHGSSYDRTLMSGILFNAGFFPPSGAELWNGELQWQPVPIFTSPPEIDNILRIEKVPCPRLAQLKKDFYEKGKIMRELCTKHADDIVYIEKHTGLKAPCTTQDGYRNLVVVQDTLLVETEQNLTLPEWTTKVYPEPLNTFRNNFYIEVEDPEIKKFIAGPFLSVIAADLLDVAGWTNYSIPKTIYTAEPSKAPRLHLFSAHDVNLIILLRSLGVYPNKNPNYSAAVGLELRKKDGQYYVTVVYENSLDEKPTLLAIPQCNGVCTLRKFLSIITPLMHKKFDAECDLHHSATSGKTRVTSRTHKHNSNHKHNSTHKRFH